MNKTSAEIYNSVLFKDKQMELVGENLAKKKENLLVLELIKQNTKHPSQPDGPGITKEQIREHLQFTRPMCDIVISFLSGATLVYYEEPSGRGKYYHLTSRGTYVYAYLKNKGVIGDD